MTPNELINLFFSELKKYNGSNFKTLKNADLKHDGDDPVVRKAFSSVLTRYSIFCEKHPEVDKVNSRIMYYRLGLDKIGLYFSEYPDTTADNFVCFQVELRKYVKANQDKDEEEETA